MSVPTRPGGGEADRSATAQRDARLALALEETAGNGHCPPSEDIVAWREGSLPRRRSRQVASHVSRCGRCFEMWEALVESLPATRPQQGPNGLALQAVRGLAALLGDRRALAGAAVAVVAAAGFALSLLMFSGEPITRYDLALQDSSVYRGASGERAPLRITLRDGDRFEARLRPATATDEALTARVLQVTEVGTVDLGLTLVRYEQGMIAVTATVGGDALRLPPGDSSLLLVVGRAGKLPEPAALQAALAEDGMARARHWQAWRVDVTLAEP